MTALPPPQGSRTLARLSGRWPRSRELTDLVYRELIDMLFDMVPPLLGMGLAIIGASTLFAIGYKDGIAAVIAVAAALVTAARMLTIFLYRRRRALADRPALRRWERLYAIGCYATALLIAALNLRALAYHYPMLHMITVSLVFGFGAGIVSRISFRPKICVTSLLLAAVPTIVGLALQALHDTPIPLHRELFAFEALVVAMTLGLSLQTVRDVCRAVVRSVKSRHDLTFLANRDALTGLPNRLSLRDRFDRSMRRMKGSDGQLALHFIDLDGFKAVNDRYGHPAGDALLKLVALRLSAVIREEDTVARLGGDEFVVLQAGISAAHEAEALAARIVRTLSDPYGVEGTAMRISASVGIALAPDQARDLEQLAACADVALYRSKRAGKGRIHLCTPEEALHAAG